MDICIPLLKQQTCRKHGSPITIFNSDPKVDACCLICLQNLPDMTLAEQIFNQQQQIYDKAKQKIDENHQLLISFLNCLLIYKENIISSLDQIKQLIIDQIDIVNQSQSKLDLIFKSDSNQSKWIEDLEQICNNQEKDVKDQLNKQLQFFSQKFSDIGELLAILGNYKEQKNEVIIQMRKQQTINQEVKIESQSKLKKFQYELIKELTLKQEEWCIAFAFNKDNSILVVACGQEIIVYQFINGQISKEMQRLKNHTYPFYCLYFMRNSNSFVSGSFQNSIIIWVLDENNKYIAQQELKEHNGSVMCVIMNKNEDQIISGSKDYTIKVWINMSGSWACSQSISTKHEVRNMSLNELEDKLIITFQSYLKSSIQILVQQNDQKWSIVQTLDFSDHVYRLCFTIGDQFVVQNRTSNSLEIYDYDENQRKFKTVSQVQMQQVKTCCGLFPCQFIKPLNILTFKHGKYLNIFKVNENYNYELIQTIKYGDQDVHGRMTDDGQYLVTNKTYKKIQIRQLKYLK